MSSNQRGPEREQANFEALLEIRHRFKLAFCRDCIANTLEQVHDGRRMWFGIEEFGTPLGSRHDLSLCLRHHPAERDGDRHRRKGQKTHLPPGACGRYDRSLWLQQPGDVLQDDLHLEVLGITGNRPNFGCSLAHVARPRAGQWQLDSHHVSVGGGFVGPRAGETSKTPRPALTTTRPGEAPDYGWTELMTSPLRRTMAHSVKRGAQKRCRTRRGTEACRADSGGQGLPPRQRRVVAAVAKEASSRALRLFGLPPQRPAGHLNARACTP